MSALTAAMETALSADSPLMFGALKIVLPSHTICLLDGAGTVTFCGDTYVGRHDTFGTLESIDAISDGSGDEAPALRITLMPTTGIAATTLANPLMQGSPVYLWLGAINRATGLAVADPSLLFQGELDQPTLRVGKGTRTLDYDCVSVFERLFDTEEGMRLSDAFHKEIWPGETGLANVTGVARKVYWGVEGAGGNVTPGGIVGGMLGSSGK